MPVVLLGALSPMGSFWECNTMLPIALEGLAGTAPFISLLQRLAHRLNAGSGTWDHTLPPFVHGISHIFLITSSSLHILGWELLYGQVGEFNVGGHSLTFH